MKLVPYLPHTSCALKLYIVRQSEATANKTKAKKNNFFCKFSSKYLAYGRRYQRRASKKRAENTYKQVGAESQKV